MTVEKKEKPFKRLSNIFMFFALFTNPFGFDIIQYWLLTLTGNLWRANFVLYCVTGVFFGLSAYFTFLSRRIDKDIN
jgi:hypothetical protein